MIPLRLSSASTCEQMHGHPHTSTYSEKDIKNMYPRKATGLLLYRFQKPRRLCIAGPGRVNSAGDGPGGKGRSENNPEGQKPWPRGRWREMENSPHSTFPQKLERDLQWPKLFGVKLRGRPRVFWGWETSVFLLPGAKLQACSEAC